MDDEWIDLQEKAFLSWANKHLRDGGYPPAESLTDSFKDGVLLHNLLSCLCKTKPQKGTLIAHPKHQAQQLDNLKNCFNLMQHEGITLVNVGCADIHSGSKKLTLALFWALILHYDICKFTDGKDKAKAKGDLLLWVQNRCEEGGITVENFTSDFRDGKALAALCASIAPHEFNRLSDGSVHGAGDILEKVTIDDAVEMTARTLGSPCLLDACDIGKDEQSMMMFLAQFYQQFGTKEEVELNRKTELDISRVEIGQCGIEGEGVTSPLRYKVNKFTITPRDANGEIVHLKLRQINASVTSLNGTTVPIQLKRNEDGSFEASYVPVELGRHMLDVQINGQHVTECPRLIEVVDSLPDPSKCTAFGPGLNGAKVSVGTEFTVETRGSDGSIVDVTPDRVKVRIIDSNGHMLPPVPIERTANGTFNVHYTPVIPGVYEIFVEVDGKNIRDSPWKINVTPSEASAQNCFAYGPGLEGGSPNEKMEFFVEAHDVDGSPSEIPQDKLSVFVCGPSGLVNADVSKTSRGYAVSFVPPAEGNFFIDVKVGGVSVTNCPRSVIVKKPKAVVDPHRSTVDGVGDCEVGVTHEFVIHTLTHSGEAVTDTDLDRVKVIVTNSKKKVEIVTLDRGEDGFIRARFTPNSVGSACACVMLDGQPLNGFPCNFSVFKRPPIVDLERSEVFGVRDCDINVRQNYAVFPRTKDGVTIEDLDLERIQIVLTNSIGDKEKVDLSRGSEGEIIGSFVPSSPGQWSVSVTIDGKELIGHPSTFMVIPPKFVEPDPVRTLIIGLEDFAKDERDFEEKEGYLDRFVEERFQRRKKLISKQKKEGNGEIEPSFDVEEDENGKRNVKVTRKVTPSEAYDADFKVEEDGTDSKNRKVIRKGKTSGSEDSFGVEEENEKEKRRFRVKGKPEVVMIVPRSSDGGIVPDLDLDKFVVTITDRNQVVKTVGVTQDDNGAYFANFIPMEGGENLVNIAYNGVPFADCPYKLNVIDADPKNFVVTGVEDCDLNVPHTIRIQPRSSDGKPTDVDLGIIKVSVQNSNGDLEDIHLESGSDGEIIVTFTPSSVGQSSIDIRFDGDSLPNFPCQFDVRSSQKVPPRHLVSENCFAYGPGLNDITCDEGTHFFIETRDQLNEPFRVDNVNEIKISIHQPNGQLLSVTSVSEVDEGKYQCTYTPHQAGPHVIDIEVKNKPIKENPFSVLCADKVSDAPSQKKRGYLNKQGGVRKNWKRRYFELDDTTFSYFEDKGAANLGSIPIDTIAKVYDVSNLKNHKYAFAVEQTGDSRVYLLEASSEEERREWIDAITSKMGKRESKKDTKGKEEQHDEGNNQFDLTGCDAKLSDFYHQLFFEINYPKSALIVNELFRIRIHVSTMSTKEAVVDHKGKLEALINMPNGQTAVVEAVKGTTPGVWVVMFTPTMEGRHACNVRFLGKYIQHKTATLSVTKKKSFGFL